MAAGNRYVDVVRKQNLNAHYAGMGYGTVQSVSAPQLMSRNPAFTASGHGVSSSHHLPISDLPLARFTDCESRAVENMTTAPSQLESTCHRGLSYVVKIDSHSREVFSCALFSFLVAQNIGQSMTAMTAQPGSRGAPSAICVQPQARSAVPHTVLSTKHNSGLQDAAKVGIRSGGQFG